MSSRRFPLDTPVKITINTFSDSALTNPGDPNALDLSLMALDTVPPVETDYTWAAGDLIRTGLGVFVFTTTPASGNYAFHGKATGAVATGIDGQFKVLTKYAMDVSVDEFASYLNNPDLDRDRAQEILDDAHDLCETIIDPLPRNARSVVLDVAERAFANPAPTGTPAYYAEGEGPFNDVTPGVSGGGLYLTQENKATLRRLNGSGGAFTIDCLPATAGQGLPWWDTSAVTDGWDVPA